MCVCVRACVRACVQRSLCIYIVHVNIHIYTHRISPPATFDFTLFLYLSPLENPPWCQIESQWNCEETQVCFLPTSLAHSLAFTSNAGITNCKSVLYNIHHSRQAPDIRALGEISLRCHFTSWKRKRPVVLLHLKPPESYHTEKTDFAPWCWGGRHVPVQLWTACWRRLFKYDLWLEQDM